MRQGLPDTPASRTCRRSGAIAKACNKGVQQAAQNAPRRQRLASQRRFIDYGLAVLQSEHAVAEGEALIAMRNHHDGRARLEIEHCPDDFPLRRNVDRARCFVEHEQEGPAEHGAGKAQPLALAPEMSVPRSPSMVSSPAVKPVTKPSTPGMASASQISASLACGLAHNKFRRMVSRNKYGS